MNWQVVARPEAENDIAETAEWYDSQRAGLGAEFIEEVLTVLGRTQHQPTTELPKTSYQKHALALPEEVSLSGDL